MNQRQPLLLTATAALLAGTLPPLAAQPLQEAQVPTPRVGDVWRYRTRDLWNDRQVGVVNQRLAETQPDRHVLRVGSSPEREATVLLDHNMVPCYTMKNSSKVQCGGPFSFPMRVGSTHAFDKQPWPNGLGHTSEQCETVAAERVTVPAGTFDTLRIECKGFWTRSFEGTGSGRVQETFWYAPQVHRSVQSRYETWTAAGAPDTRQFTELLAYLPAGADTGASTARRPTPAAASAQVPASGPPAPDADWDGRYACAATRQGSRDLPALALQFSGVTVGGQFAAQKGAERRPGWIYLHGKVAADGHALLQWEGIVDNPAQSPQAGARSGDAYSFSLSVRFSGARAEGQRIDRPECTLTLVRQ
jgi:hypothetical protein